MRQRPSRLIIILAIACAGIGIFALAGTAAAVPSTPALMTTPTATSYITFVQTGTCDDLGDTVAQLGDLETSQAEGGEGQLRGSIASPPVLSTDKTIEVSFDKLSSSPHSITVRRRDTTGTALIACGPISAVANNGQMAIGLQPMTSQNVAGIAVIKREESGDGTHIAVYLLSVVAEGGGAGVTPTS
jgi:hypothetical protein